MRSDREEDEDGDEEIELKYVERWWTTTADWIRTYPGDSNEANNFVRNESVESLMQVRCTVCTVYATPTKFIIWFYYLFVCAQGSTRATRVAIRWTFHRIKPAKLKAIYFLVLLAHGGKQNIRSAAVCRCRWLHFFSVLKLLHIAKSNHLPLFILVNFQHGWTWTNRLLGGAIYFENARIIIKKFDYY